MKTLSNIIKESNAFYDEMYWHLMLSFGEPLEDNLYEGKSLPKWLEHDSEIIGNKIIEIVDKHPKLKYKFKQDISLLNNSKIFNDLTVLIDYDRGLTYPEGYISTPKTYSDICVLRITLPVKNILSVEVESAIAHELLHRHVYYLNSKDELGISNFRKRLNKISYNEISKNYNSKEESVIRGFVRSLIYYTNTDEFNAFFNQLFLEIKKSGYNTADKAYEILKNNIIYCNYIWLKTHLENDFSKEHKQICNIYREYVPGGKKLTDKRIIYKLRDRLKKLERKLWNIIPEIFTEGHILAKGNMRNLKQLFN